MSCDTTRAARSIAQGTVERDVRKRIVMDNPGPLRKDVARCYKRKNPRDVKMTDFFDTNIVLHTHIEMTEGSMLVRGLVRALGEEKVHDLRSRNNSKPELLSDEKRKSIHLLSGHFHYGTQDKYFDRTPIYIACVRPPLDRFRSYYDFVKVRPGHPAYASVADKSFAQAVEHLLGAERPRLNGMARALTGRPQPDGKQLLAHLEDCYLIVSPHHRVNDTLGALIPLFGGRADAKPLHADEEQKGTGEDIAGLEAAFNDANALDCELVRYVGERYESWLANLSARLDQRRQAGRSQTAHRRQGPEPTPDGAAEGELSLQSWVDKTGAIPLAWVSTSREFPDPNLGDALSPVIVSAMTGLPIQHKNFSYEGERLVAVGTIGHSQRNGTIHFWGTGVDDGASSAKGARYVRPPSTNFHAHAMRGPYSARALRREGIFAPEIYGDPVWFLPKLVKNRSVPKRWELGIVVHISELREKKAGAPIKDTLVRCIVPPDLQSSVRIINTYTECSVEALFDKVDEMRACRRIASTSFHGLVIAETFQIPCLWFAKYACGSATVDIDDSGVRVDHRVRDFYAGAQKRRFSYYGSGPSLATKWDELLRAIDTTWSPLNVDSRPLFDAFPLRKSVRFEDETWSPDWKILNSIAL